MVYKLFDASPEVEDMRKFVFDGRSSNSNNTCNCCVTMTLSLMSSMGKLRSSAATAATTSKEFTAKTYLRRALCNHSPKSTSVYLRVGKELLSAKLVFFELEVFQNLA